MAIDEYEQQIQAATAAALRGERVRWRVEAVWPLALWLDTPFRAPPHWESEGSGAGFGERDAAWWTGPLSEAEVQAEIDKIELPIDVVITKEARPDDAESTWQRDMKAVFIYCLAVVLFSLASVLGWLERKFNKYVATCRPATTSWAGPSTYVWHEHRVTRHWRWLASHSTLDDGREEAQFISGNEDTLRASSAHIHVEQLRKRSLT